jgi:hypothetical protein
MDDANLRDNPFECVEPELGELLWQYGMPGVDPALRAKLTDHLTICDACRFTLATEERVIRGLQAGSLTLRQPARPRWARFFAGILGPPRGRVLAFGGALTLAASLVLMFLVPPSPAGGGLRRAAADAPRFTRPVEGEVIWSANPRLTWSAVPGASSYRLEVSRIGGRYEWQGESTTRRLRIPADAALPRAGRYRAILHPVPADLAGPGGISVSFERGDLGSFLGYRLVAAPRWIQILGLLGLLTLAAAFSRPLWRRRSLPANR